MNQVPNVKFTISSATILRVALWAVFFYLLYFLRDVVLIFFVALIFSSAIVPAVDWMQRRGIPRYLGVTLIYALIFCSVGLLVYLLVRPIRDQFINLVQNFPLYLAKITSSFSNIRNYLEQIKPLEYLESSFSLSQLKFGPGGVWATVSKFLDTIVGIVVALVATFYFSVEENGIKKIVISITPKNYQNYVLSVVLRMQNKIGQWIRGQLVLCSVVSFFVYISLSFLGIEYALVLALLAFFAEFIPYLGPIIAAIPAVVLALAVSPTLAIIVIVVYYSINFLENHLLVPKIMQNAVGLHPVLVIAALIVGFKLAGVVGALLAVPVTTAGSVLFKDFIDKSSDDI